jgi:hypothetical protein
MRVPRKLTSRMGLVFCGALASACGGRESAPDLGPHAEVPSQPAVVSAPEPNELVRGLCRVPTEGEWESVASRCLPVEWTPRQISRLRKTLVAWGQYSGLWAPDLMETRWFVQTYPELIGDRVSCLCKMVCFEGGS